MSIIKCPSVSLFMAFVFKSIFSDKILLHQLFFCCPFFWNIFSQPFTFSLCRSFVLRWVSCRQLICRSCFLTHSATLCLLIGAFNQFIFKVIIDRYLFIAIFTLCTCVPLSLLLLFLRAVPLVFLAVLVWWRHILLAFFCLGSSLFHLPF